MVCIYRPAMFGEKRHNTKVFEGVGGGGVKETRLSTGSSEEAGRSIDKPCVAS